MKSKYINTFDTTADYNNYIESALPAFPNVGYDKEADKVNIVRTSPNDHLFYGELVDATQNIPNIQLYNKYSKVQTYTPTVDTLTNEFYIDDWETVPRYNTLGSDFLTNKSNIKTIKKFKGLDTSSVVSINAMLQSCTSLQTIDLSGLDTSSVTIMTSFLHTCTSLSTVDLSVLDTSSVTNIDYLFYNDNNLTSINLSDCDFSNVTSQTLTFTNCKSLTDVYITVEATLNKLTNNLSSCDNDYIPSSATIHYNDVDYKWQNNKWTKQTPLQ